MEKFIDPFSQQAETADHQFVAPIFEQHIRDFAEKFPQIHIPIELVSGAFPNPYVQLLNETLQAQGVELSDTTENAFSLRVMTAAELKDTLLATEKKSQGFGEEGGLVAIFPNGEEVRRIHVVTSARDKTAVMHEVMQFLGECVRRYKG